MEWKQLDSSTLESLKTGEKILMFRNNYEYPHDIISFLDLRETGCSQKEMQHHWTSLLHSDYLCCPNAQEHIYEYSDEEVLDLFSHYLVIKEPK